MVPKGMTRHFYEIEKNELGISTSIHKNNSKCITYLNIEHETILLMKQMKIITLVKHNPSKNDIQQNHTEEEK